jgi:hypothetical protein
MSAWAEGWPKWAYRGHLEDKPPVEPDEADEIEVVPLSDAERLREAIEKARKTPLPTEVDALLFAALNPERSA